MHASACCGAFIFFQQKPPSTHPIAAQLSEGSREKIDFQTLQVNRQQPTEYIGRCQNTDCKIAVWRMA